MEIGHFTQFFFPLFFLAGGWGKIGEGKKRKKGGKKKERKEKEITLRDNSLTCICSFLELKKWEVSLWSLWVLSRFLIKRHHINI